MQHENLKSINTKTNVILSHCLQSIGDENYAFNDVTAYDGTDAPGSVRHEDNRI